MLIPHVSGEAQVKTTATYHDTTVGMGEIWNPENLHAGEHGGEKDSHSLLVGMQVGAATMGATKQQTLRPHAPAPMLLGSFMQRNPTLMATQKPARGVYHSFIHDCPSLETNKLPLGRRMDNPWLTQTIE